MTASSVATCVDVSGVLEESEKIGFPVILCIQHAIELSTDYSSNSADLVRLAKNRDEADVIAATMLKKREADLLSRRQRKIHELEKKVFHLNAKLKALTSKIAGPKERNELAPQTALQRDAVSDELRQLTASRPPPIEIRVSAASRQDGLFYGHEYMGHPMWDPELATSLMPCDRATAALRASYLGSLGLAQRLGVSGELHAALARVEDRPAALAAEEAEHRRVIAQLEADRTSENLLAAARERLRAAQEEEPAARAAAAHAARELAALERRCAGGDASPEPYAVPRDDGRELPAGDPQQADHPGLSAAQRRLARAAAEEAMQDELDRTVHPAFAPPLHAQINAINHRQTRTSPATPCALHPAHLGRHERGRRSAAAAVAAARGSCVEHLLAMGALFLTPQRRAEVLRRADELAAAQADLALLSTHIKAMQADAAVLNNKVEAAETEIAELRQRIQALPDDDVDIDAPAARASLGRAFAASRRTARELRAQKLALGHELDAALEEESRLLLLVPTASTELDSLVNVLSDTSGTTPLHAACQAGRAEAVAQLMRGSASADAVDSHGNTPVHIATAEGHAGCLDKIVEFAGAFTLRTALSSQNDRGERPVDLARDPLCRQALARAVLVSACSVTTPFVMLPGKDSAAPELDSVPFQKSPEDVLKEGQAVYSSSPTPYAIPTVL